MLATVKEVQPTLPVHIDRVEANIAPIGITQEKVRYGELRQAAFWAFGDVLHLLRVVRWKIDYETHGVFSRDQELPYFESITVEKVVSAVEEAMSEIVPGDVALCNKAIELADSLNEASDIVTLFEAMKTIYELYQEILVQLVALSEAKGYHEEPFFAAPGSVQQLNLQATPNLHQGHIIVSFPTHFGSNLMEAIQSNIRWLRTEGRPPTFVEFIMEHIAYVFLTTGKQLSSLSFAHEGQFLGTVGFRPVSQTYPSLTDPGEGHIFGTMRKQRWMNGAIVHVEHLERPGGVPRSLIESYRIPAILDFARTRLHTAGAMPNTYFTGRALRDSEGSFEHSFIKVVNTTSAACSQAFSLGAAECKIAMDDLSTSQMIAYLQALAGHTLRSPLQYLSCAFNLNSPIVHDTKQDEDGNILPPHEVTDRFEIAQLAIEIASAGGFDKVTWDGASNTYPSKCIIHQLPYEQWLFLAHRAHECGLTTYASAGFKFPQICFGVWAGIDGLGIGGAQILRHMDHNSGMHGPYTEENLDRILKARDDAAQHVRGRGVTLLARLDRMSFEGTLTHREDALRRELFDILSDADEHGIESMLKAPELQAIMTMPDDGQRPFTAWAQRLLRHRYGSEEIILQSFATEPEWKTLMAQLSGALGSFGPSVNALGRFIEAPMAKTAPKEVEDEVFDTHVGRIWTKLRLSKAHATSQGYALSRHDNVVKVKTTPFSSNAESRRSSVIDSRRSSADGSRRSSNDESRRSSSGSPAHLPTSKGSSKKSVPSFSKPEWEKPTKLASFQPPAA